MIYTLEKKKINFLCGFFFFLLKMENKKKQQLIESFFVILENFFGLEKKKLDRTK